MFRPFVPRTESAAQRKARSTSQVKRAVTSKSVPISKVTLTLGGQRADDMKEQTYGWYPPARSIWDQRKERTSYDKECLYKHWGSKYNDRAGVPTPVAPTPIRIMNPPTRPSTSASRPPSRPASTQPQTEGLSISGVRPPSVDSARISISGRKKPSAQPRRSAWAARLAATKISVPHYSSVTSVAPQPTISVDTAPVPNRLTSGTPARRTPDRTQSATCRRTRTTPPPRPSRSAGSCRDPETQEPDRAPTGNPPSEREVAAPSPPPPSPPMSSVHCPPGRPDAPMPPSAETEDEGSEAESCSGTLDYEEQLEKYGWRFEVPGDPYNLKKPCLPVRHPYTVKLATPTVAPNPPRGHMMNYDTYFLNTIPRKPATFTIHKEWISEVLNAKRLDLQKREGLNYNFKQYAFIY